MESTAVIRNLKIVGSPWQVHRVGENDMPADNCFGITNYGDRTIHIVDAMTPHDELDTIVHELLHAAIHDMAIAFPSQAAEERLVRPLAAGIAAAMVQTPKLLAVLTRLSRDARAFDKLSAEQDSHEHATE